MVLHLLRLPPRPLLLAIPLSIGLGVSLRPQQPSSIIRCDYGGPSSIAHPTQQSWAHQTQGQGPSSHSRYGISAATARQISLGSVLGLLFGLGLRIFSRPLAFTIGLGILAVEWAASKGYNIVPTTWLQRHVKSVDVHRLLTENIPFKASFGSTMFLAAFTDFDTQEE